MEKYDVKKGESLEVHLKDIVNEVVFDADWSATSQVLDAPAGTILLTPTITKSTDQLEFIFKLTPTETDALAIGTKYVNVVISNSVTNFVKEVHFVFEIEESWKA